MASFRKLKDKWLAEVRIKGKYRSKTFGSKGEAKAWADDEERKINKSGDLIYGKTLGDAFKRYAHEESPKKKGARWEVIRLEKFRRDDIASIQLTDLTSEDIEKWVKRQDISNSSIRRELQVMSPVLTKCKKWKWIEESPLKEVEMPEKSKPREKTYTQEQIDRVLLALSYTGVVKNNRHQIAVAFLLALETAMRQGEIWGLFPEDIHWEECFAHLEDTKNGDSRDVPLSIRAIKLLRSMPMIPSKRIFDFSQASAGVIFRRALQLAGIEEMTFHDTRHTATTRLGREFAQKKLSVLDLAKMTGHKDLRSLMIYFNPNAHDIAKMLD